MCSLLIHVNGHVHMSTLSHLLWFSKVTDVYGVIFAVLQVN